MADVNQNHIENVRGVLARGKEETFGVMVERKRESFVAVAAAARRIKAMFPDVELSPYMNRALGKLELAEAQAAA